MKRLFLIAVFAFLLPSLYAQNPDEIVSSSDDLQYDNSLDVSPTLRKTDILSGNDTKYSRFFLESLLAVQRDGSMGLGTTFAYLPNVLGGYVSSAAYHNHDMFTGGLAVRPLAGIVKRTDWQLFGGLAYAKALKQPFKQPVGFEIGTRFGANAEANGGKFAWWSLSFSRLYVNNNTYYTLGLSINLSALFGLWVIL